MGIPRLWHDLLPYANRVFLGAAPEVDPNAITIRHLVIDGPSLVYFVYDKLLAYRSANALNLAVLPPAYDKINQGIRHLLGDIHNHGVSIQHIFFDGGLPHYKREVRVSRMEKVRQQLDIFRKLYPEFPPNSPLSAADWDLEKVLWGQSAMSSRGRTLPPPPFMVASAIESLRELNSQWREKVEIVPGEADMYCARAAAGCPETVAILTSDADLAVHDLGPHGRVAMLHSIEKEHKKSSLGGLTSLTASSIHPSLVASRLKVPSLLALGFERSMNSSASTAVIRGRAADSSRLEQRECEYTTFIDEFRPSTMLSANDQPDLDDIDPRIAELIVSINDAHHVYLTPVVEDPQRDASCSYGTEIRQMAYSILLSSAMSEKNRTDAVIEYARKGPRIAPATLIVLKRTGILSQAAHLEELLAAHLPPSDHGLPSSASAALLAWYTLATHLVHEEKLRLGKPLLPLSQVVRLLSLVQTAAPPTINWDDLHLLANIHSVLYSLRMLYQITGYVIKQTSLRPGCATDEEFSKITDSVHMSLSGMLPIADLFFDIPHLHGKFSDVTMETRNLTLLRLTELLEPGTFSPYSMGETSADSAERQDAEVEHGSGQWISAEPKKQRKGGRYSERMNAPIRNKNNIFGLLPDEAD